jgi:hypothetical protein
LPFTLAWSIVAKSCLPFTILPYKTILYSASSHDVLLPSYLLIINHGLNHCLLLDDETQS